MTVKQSQPLKVEAWPVEKIVPYARNPRKNEGVPVAKVKASLKEYGWRQMNREDGYKVVQFALKHENSPNIVVHCNVGESRSKGAALAIAEFTGRVALHMSDRGRVTQHERTRYDFFNRRVYEMILMEHMLAGD